MHIRTIPLDRLHAAPQERATLLATLAGGLAPAGFRCTDPWSLRSAGPSSGTMKAPMQSFRRTFDHFATDGVARLTGQEWIAKDQRSTGRAPTTAEYQQGL